ncbi:MAG: RrF2 family transcriptional regulator [Blautia sp.]|jgi:Rrf2 family protein
MFITRECDYAVRVIRALAGEKRLSATDICEKEEITAPFAYKILKKLQKAKIITGFRGVHGGYALKKDVQQITLLDVYQAIEPDIFIIECLNPKKPCVHSAKLEHGCKVHTELERIQGELYKMLSEKTMGDILECEDE